MSCFDVSKLYITMCLYIMNEWTPVIFSPPCMSFGSHINFRIRNCVSLDSVLIGILFSLDSVLIRVFFSGS